MKLNHKKNEIGERWRARGGRDARRQCPLPQEEARLQTDGQELPRRGPTAAEPAVVAGVKPPRRARARARARVIVQRAN